MAKIVVVDSDAIFALYNPNDQLNPTATRTFRQLLIQKFQLVYPASVIFEIVSLFQRVLPSSTVIKKLIEMIKDDTILIFPIDIEILKESADLFDPAGSKKNTLIDCSVVAVAKKIKADGVFAYDNFYVKQGLKTAEDLTKKT